MLNTTGYLSIGLAAILSEQVNAIAGGGSLISFPALTAMGLPAVIASMSIIIALIPGFL